MALTKKQLMQTQIRILAVAAMAVLFASCNKTNTQGKLIPKEATVVVHVDGKSLAAKLSWAEVKQNPFFKDMGGDTSMPGPMKRLLNNPDSAGIDAGGDLLFFAVKDSIGGYVALEGNIKDEKLFKAFNQEITENGVESEKDGINYISKSPLCVGFSKEKFVYVFDAPQMAGMDALSKRMQQDSIDLPAVKPRDIGATCKAVFALKEDATLAKNEKFSKLLKEGGDMHLWVNGEELGKGASANPMMAMVNLDKFYKGSVTTATLTFDNGKISIASKSFIGEDLGKIYKKYSGGKVSADMIKRMPGKDIVGLMALSFNPEGIREILKMMNLDGLANMGLSQAGFTMDDFIKANKGDILIGASDLVMKTDSMKYAIPGQDDMATVREKPEFNFVFATTIGDKDAFNKLVNAGKKFGAKQTSDSGKAPFAYSSNSNLFAIANTKENADKYLNGSNNTIDFISKIDGQAFGGYLNINMLLKSFASQAAKDSSAKVIFDASLKLWDNILMKGGDFSDGAITQTVEINLLDKTTNSLKQLNQYAATLGEVYKAKKDKQKADMMAFQDAMPPLPDTTAPAKTK